MQTQGGEYRAAVRLLDLRPKRAVFRGQFLPQGRYRQGDGGGAVLRTKDDGCAFLRFQIGEVLLRQNQDEAGIIRVLWLQEKGLLDDGRYAGMVVRHYAGKGYGPGRVRQELQRRGIPRELWEAALEQLPEQDDKIESFLRARLRDPEDRAQVQKVSAALIRRGFSWEEIRAALARFRADGEEY